MNTFTKSWSRNCVSSFHWIPNQRIFGIHRTGSHYTQYAPNDKYIIHSLAVSALWLQNVLSLANEKEKSRIGKELKAIHTATAKIVSTITNNRMRIRTKEKWWNGKQRTKTNAEKMKRAKKGAPEINVYIFLSTNDIFCTCSVLRSWHYYERESNDEPFRSRMLEILLRSYQWSYFRFSVSMHSMIAFRQICQLPL